MSAGVSFSVTAAARVLPSPLDFAVHALEGLGGLVEREAGGEGEGEGRGAAVLLPAEVARRLELPEECRLSPYPAAHDVGCGVGSPLLERLVADARQRPAAAAVRLDVEPPRVGHVRALFERFVLRNGLSELVQVTTGTAVYVTASVAYVVEADDRREGLVTLTAAAADGAVPDRALGEALDLAWPSPAVRPAAGKLDGAGAERFLVTRAERSVRAAIQPVLDDVARRHARDHERIASYFAELAAEARAPRRRVDPKAVEAKVAHLVAERDAKLRDLGVRFAVKVSSSLAALVVAEVPAAFLQVKLRRRKESREVVLRAPALAHALDQIACDGCAGATGHPAACDDRLHLLCEGCAPSAQGRLSCPACAARR